MSPSLPTHPSRRRILTLIGGLGGLGLLTVAGCGGNDAPGASSSRPRAGAGSTTIAAPSTTPVTAAASCTQVPQETAGPYPGDGSNGPNVLAQNGVVRSDIRSSMARRVAPRVACPSR